MTTPHLGRALRASAVALALLGAACFRDRNSGGGEITPAERAAFQAPADSSVAAAQVDRYLRTTLSQLRIIQGEGPGVRQRLPAPGAAADSPSPDSVWGAFVDEAFVRAAREQRYNPAELWYVRARLSETAGHLQASKLHISGSQGAALLRRQAESMRGTPGVTQAQIDAMLQAANRAERWQAPPPPPPRLAQNLGELRRARASLSDSAWIEVAKVAGGIGLDDLASAPEPQFASRLAELRMLYEDALANREPRRR
jgi:hypothetical protein